MKASSPIWTGSTYDRKGNPTPPSSEDAVLLGSRVGRSKHHIPVLDIDLPAELYPSTTEGHHHLVIACEPMRWWRYRILLRVLVWAGIIEKNYYRASKARRCSYIRMPGALKKKVTQERMKDILEKLANPNIRYVPDSQLESRNY